MKYTKEMLEPIIKESITWAEVCRKLGVKPMTGAQTHIKNRAVKFGIVYSHFVGNRFNKGRTFAKRPVTDYLFLNGPLIKSHTLKIKLFRDGLKEAKCEWCEIKEWLKRPAPLELDHINRNHDDNRLENLQILCANCHSLKTKADRRK